VALEGGAHTVTATLARPAVTRMLGTSRLDRTPLLPSREAAPLIPPKSPEQATTQESLPGGSADTASALNAVVCVEPHATDERNAAQSSCG
jgi:hypothetical protein